MHVGQLNFFKCNNENDILKYIGNNLKDIEEDMNQNIKKPTVGKEKGFKKGECSTKKPSKTLIKSTFHKEKET